MKHHKGHIYLLFLGTCALYALTLGHQFTLDDAMVLTQNQFVQTSNYWAILTTDAFAGFFQHSYSDALVEGGRYRPLTLLLFALIWSITEAAWVFHLLNVLVYAVTVVMIYLLVWQFRTPQFTNNQQRSLAWFTALLFAIHPIHTEVVNNIKGLDDLLSLFLALLAWWMILKQSPKQNWHSFTWVFVVMLLAMLAKESAIVILPLAGLSLWFFQKLKIRFAMLQILPLILAVFVYLLVRLAVIDTVNNTGAIASAELMNNPFLVWQNNQWLPMPWDSQFGTIFHALGIYLTKALFPLTLSHDYYPHTIPTTDLWAWPSIMGLLSYLALLVYTSWGMMKQQIPAFAASVYLISLALFANVFFTIGTLLAERFLYIPSLGVCLFLAWLYLLLCRQYSHAKPLMFGVNVLACLLLLAALWQTINRSKDWHDNLTLFEADILKSAESAKLNNALGGELIERSQQPPIKGTPQEQQELQRAIMYLNRAIDLHPTYAMPHMSLGNGLHYLGQHEAALQSYARAQQLNPGDLTTKKNAQKVSEFHQQQQLQASLLVLEQQAIALSQQGQFEPAITAFTDLIKTQPKPKYWFFRGVALAQSGQLEEALKDFKMAEQKTDAANSENLLRIWQALATTHQQLNQPNRHQYYLQKIATLRQTN